MPDPVRTVFVTGTDTEIGKTLISAGLVWALTNQGFKTVGMKPIASGSEMTAEGLRNDDAQKLIAASNVEVDYSEINPYCFEPAISPHFAAAETGDEISLDLICRKAAALQKQSDRLIIEGVGGWQVPLSDRERVSDLADKLSSTLQPEKKIGVILVIGLRLGCINHAILTAEAIRASGFKLISVVASQIDPEYQRLKETLNTLEAELDAELDYVPYLQDPTAEAAASYLTKTITKLQ